MATQVIGAERQRRSRLGVVLIAMALAFAAAVLVTQASSIWSGGGSTVHTGTAQYTLNQKEMKQLYSGINLPPAGCRVKFGCEQTQSSPPQP